MFVRYLHNFGFGAYHTGVEIAGKEYTFAGGAGIFDMPPKEGKCSCSEKGPVIYSASEEFSSIRAYTGTPFVNDIA
jgi:hypothetical protein